ncbi:uncharacterized protein BO97DRAFT_352411 [Aspergillus homomorphus CBS 101889]|uniref:Uncharacterized protein n=1 Tax=Aspergillus homomorphus (strain CBS 101889) TaxID=1450537 RepID=A0A395HPL5_ASPHC|nr:hypothetical protein BO97DRAFT_352411 [Aspergillus homomorphus CBS 101889]RAL09205.1 hypothetical protein BO97DRAFT_352411 [Aspergillus homomorphus CBS 101889]
MSRFSSADKRIRIKIERPGSLEGNSPHKRRLNLPTQEIEGWSAQDAFRELYQFWFDAIAESFSLIGGFTQTYEESAGSVTVKATLKGIPGYLGFIEYSKVTKRVSLVVADYHLLSTEAGTTVEVNNRDSTIAGLFKFRNERIKLAALSLCKDGCKFSINSRDRYWVFELEGSGSLLMCKTACMRESAVGEIERRTKSISTLRSRQSKDVSIFINSDTTLIYMGMFRHWLTVALDICDFSLPSETITTVYGDILLDRKFSGKVFLQGVLLPETKLGRGKFTYGYNLQHATVSGNRRSFSSPQEEAMRLCRIWEAAIAQKAANALQKYVFLLTDRCGPLDISDAQNHLSASTVKAIWAYLRHMDGGKNFYHANIPSDVRLHERMTLVGMAG